MAKKADERKSAMDTFRKLTGQVAELKSDGHPYKDAVRTKLEVKIEEAVRTAFGEESPEYAEHHQHRINTKSKEEIDKTIALLQDLAGRLESGHRAASPQASTAPAAPVTETKAAPEPADQPRAKGNPAASSASPSPGRIASAAETPLSSQTAHVTAAAPAVSATRPSTAPAPPSSAPSAPSPAPSIVPVPSPAALPSGDPLAAIRKLCGRFHNVTRQLRQRPEDRPTLEVEDEVDVLDLLHVLLCVEHDDIQVESWETSGVTRRALILKREGVMLTVRRTKARVSLKTINDQIAQDVECLTGRPFCRLFFCFVYDPEGRLGNPRVLEAEWTREQGGRRIEVLVSPK